MDANQAETVAANGNNASEEERNALAKDQLEFIFHLATKLEDFFRLQVMYGKILEFVKDDAPSGGYVTRKVLLTTLVDKVDGARASDSLRNVAACLPELLVDMQNAQPFPYPAYGLARLNRKILTHPMSREVFDHQHGFCTGALSMCRLVKELAGPTAAAPMTSQRLKLAVYNFPSFSLYPCGKLDKRETAASAIPTSIRQAEFFEYALGDLGNRVPPEYEGNDVIFCTGMGTKITNAVDSFVLSFDDDLWVHIASYAHPSDLGRLSITSKRFCMKSDNLGRSIVEEAAWVAMRDTHPEVVSLYSLSSGESWLGIYTLLNRNDYLSTKLQFIKNYLGTSYFELLYTGAASDFKVDYHMRKDYKDEFESMQVGRWHGSTYQYGVCAAWESMAEMFHDLADVRIPNENPLGLTEEI